MKTILVTKKEILDGGPCHNAMVFIENNYLDVKELPLEKVYEIAQSADSSWAEWLLSQKLEWTKYLHKKLNLDFSKMSDLTELAYSEDKFDFFKYIFENGGDPSTIDDDDVVINFLSNEREDIAKLILNHPNFTSHKECLDAAIYDGEINTKFILENSPFEFDFKKIICENQSLFDDETLELVLDAFEKQIKEKFIKELKTD
ncbi:hypothetical protein HOD29_02795 [archaeon]|jgi:hypothetical protein|nr:hypothetical protein [archaeon]